MSDRSYTYVIVGAGLAGASAVEGIRERDKNGSILLIGMEPDLPYDRPYDYLPFFFSDLFEFGYEAVGEASSRLETFTDWQEENKTGVIYYLRDGRVRGAMMCNVWNQVNAARELIRSQKRMTFEELRGAIPLPEPAAT